MISNLANLSNREAQVPSEEQKVSSDSAKELSFDYFEAKDKNKLSLERFHDQSISRS